MWERGLKYESFSPKVNLHGVVPSVGTWIEIAFSLHFFKASVVVPSVGTWIEIVQFVDINRTDYVVPSVGTWIEML